MTVQASDSVIYKKKKYTLIDIEKEKQIIDCAKFQMPNHSPAISSGCWRGYTAEYRIENDKLYGTRYERKSGTWEEISSKELFINYTGSCIIAMAEDEKKKWYISDFLSCYLDYDIALELHFTNGTLDEVLDLGEAISELRALEATEEYRSERTQPNTRHKIREKIARKYLTYEYDCASYKWRRSKRLIKN